MKYEAVMGTIAELESRVERGKGQWETLISSLEDARGVMTREISDFSAYLEASTERTQRIVQSIRDLTDNVSQIIGRNHELFEPIEEWASSLRESIEGIEARLPETVPDFEVDTDPFETGLEALGDRLSEEAETLSEQLIAGFGNTKETIQIHIETGVTATQQALEQLVARVTEAMEAVMAAMTTLFEETAQSVSELDASIGDELEAVHTHITAKLEEIFHRLEDRIESLGGNFVASAMRIQANYQKLEEIIQTVQEISEICGSSMEAGANALSVVTDTLNSVV